jgi:hypothetical protein
MDRAYSDRIVVKNEFLHRMPRVLRPSERVRFEKESIRLVTIFIHVSVDVSLRLN